MSEINFDKRAWARYLGLYRDLKPRIALSIGISALQSLLVLPIAYLVKQAFDSMIKSGNLRGLAMDGAGILALLCIVGLLSLLARHISLKLTKGVIRDLRGSLLAQAYRVCSPFAPTSDRAWLHHAIVEDTERVDVMSNALLAVLLPAAVSGGLLAAMLLWMDFKLSLAAASVLPVVLVCNRVMGRRLRKRIEAFHHSFERFSQGVFFALRSMELTRVRGAQEWELLRQKQRAEDLRLVSGRMALSGSAYSTVQNTVTALSSLVTLVVGGGAVATGRMSLGDLASFYFLLSQLSGGLSQLWSAVPQVLTGSESLRNLQRLSEMEAQPAYTGNEKIVFAGNLELELVTFGYTAVPILSRVSLKLTPGTITAIMGANGVGKTTIAYLMMGLFKPQSGRVCADGRPFEVLDIDLLRRQMGFVTEQPGIFAGTIRENIAYGRPDAVDGEIREAATLSTADDFISMLPDGFETVIGESHVLLSSGQCQRIAIARALLDRPKALILDEPTNYLDAQSVSRLLRNLRTIDFAPAILLITHDMKIAAYADRIYELRNGSLFAIGGPQADVHTVTTLPRKSTGA